MKKILLYFLGAGAVLLGLIQLVPFGRNHTNPPTLSEPNWNSPETRQMAKEHCFQCHSNETQWPWYSNVAPASWLIQFDVMEGRAQFNFSKWNTNSLELNEMVEVINEGEMPPIQYWLFHPNSKLNEQQKQDLIKGLEASLK